VGEGVCQERAEVLAHIYVRDIEIVEADYL
jgi:hypothetical protein